MSSEQTPPYQPPPEPNISAKTLVMVLGVALVLVIAIAAAVILLAGGSSGSPSGAVKGFWSGFDDGNMKSAFDHTVMKFLPNYDQAIAPFEGSAAFGEMMDIRLSDFSVTSSSEMTPGQQSEAQATINDVMSEVNVQIDDSAYVSYSMTIKSSMYPGGSATIAGPELLCVEIDGSWYVATFSMPDMFS